MTNKSDTLLNLADEKISKLISTLEKSFKTDFKAAKTLKLIPISESKDEVIFKLPSPNNYDWRKNRRKINDEQEEQLNLFYATKNWVAKQEAEDIGQCLDLTSDFVVQWFARKRRALNESSGNNSLSRPGRKSNLTDEQREYLENYRV